MFTDEQLKILKGNEVAPKPQLNLSVKATGNDTQALLMSLREVERLILAGDSRGYDNNQNGSFNFKIRK